MILSVCTFSIQQARSFLSTQRAESHPCDRVKRAWIGFCVASDGRSPLSKTNDGPALLVSMYDVGHDQFDPDRWLNAKDPWPSLDGARAIVDFVQKLERSSERRILCVHCHAGHWRSGAVAQWLVERGVREEPISKRLSTSSSTPPYNKTIYELLRIVEKEDPR